jgi:hypothetical protein
MICQPVTLSGYAEWPKVADAVIEALRWLCEPDSGVPWEEVFVNPSRPNRVEPRVQKRRPKKYPFMTKPRHVLRNQLIQQAVGA